MVMTALVALLAVTGCSAVAHEDTLADGSEVVVSGLPTAALSPDGLVLTITRAEQPSAHQVPTGVQETDTGVAVDFSYENVFAPLGTRANDVAIRDTTIHVSQAHTSRPQTVVIVSADPSFPGGTITIAE